MNTTLDRLKFRKLKWVNCVYFYQNNVVLLLYVDDIILIGKSNDYVNKVIELLKCHFDLRILGKTQKLLGVEFQELDGNLFMHQNDYINKICELYKEFNFPVSSLPIAKGTVLSKLQCPSTSVEITEMKNYPYRSLLGSLSYIASRTRPDISYAVNILSQFQENPGIIHWNILLKLLGYLSTTRGLQLNLSRVSDLNVECYSDADFAANRDDRVSIGGFIILLDEVPISWRTSKQKCAEYVSLTDASKELLWIQRILEECKKVLDKSLFTFKYAVYCDNQAAINFSNSCIENMRTKHIDIKYHFLRDLIFKEYFELKYICTKKNVADIFTKAQTKFKLKSFLDKIFGVY
ncbi:Retrovirus-related Pol polyprotein from transposon TNT 1-94 [Araneus ventricosus]|uniref:Retrovirus-related Pol polyprotein from transposon TNT 1-94 n=1 Tax=Araneus ventricosus TaxID=182803 RepID=A0A4Y2D0C7_ARAVE|nr:Retrovirus-related Pol polyprotein from transposon TNT 1-94 [Araneus ventricosus]